MKYYTLILLFVLSGTISFSQIPPGYYNSAMGFTGYQLKTKLKTIITNGHSDQGYGSLYNGYKTTDDDKYYDNDNTVLDMYSENPTGTDPYYYNHNTRKCGNYNSEDDCYNREHLLPQSVFSSASPMKNDIHFVVPSDGYVNGQRSNLPFGEVTSPSWTSMNGSKKGPCTFPGYTGTVFEPIDEFKGDIARCLLYFATRYESQVSSWTYSNVLNGTSNQVYTQWFLDLLLTWHLNDTVNAREIARNNGAYSYQGNRNPYIDSPQWVTQIWGTPTTPSVSIQENLLSSVSIFPNPTLTKSVTITNQNNIEKVEVFSIVGSAIQEFNQNTPTGKKIELTNLPSGLLLVKLTSGQSSVVKKVLVQ